MPCRIRNAHSPSARRCPSCHLQSTIACEWLEPVLTGCRTADCERRATSLLCKTGRQLSLAVLQQSAFVARFGPAQTARMAQPGGQPLLQTQGVAIAQQAVAEALNLHQIGWKVRISDSMRPDLIFTLRSMSVAFLLPGLLQPQEPAALRTRCVPPSGSTLHHQRACCIVLQGGASWLVIPALLPAVH